MTMLMIEIRRKFAEEQFEFSKNAVDSDGVATLLKGNVMTMASNQQETLVEKQVTYTLNLNGEIVLIENVPARERRNWRTISLPSP